MVFTFKIGAVLITTRLTLRAAIPQSDVRKSKVCLCVLCSSLLSFPGFSMATSFSADSILVSKRGAIYEYTKNGQSIQSMSVEGIYGASNSGDTFERDLIAGAGGDLHVFNITRNWDTLSSVGSISTYDVNTGSWTHRTYPSFLPGSGAGITYNENTGTVYAADPASSYAEIHAFSETSYQNYSDAKSYYDVTMGLDGYLYGLANVPYYSNDRIVKFDPVTFDYLGFLDVDSNSTAFAVDAQGDIFLASYQGGIKHLTFDGMEVNSAAFAVDYLEISPGFNVDILCNYIDMDLSVSGDLLLGCSGGEVLMTNTSLGEYSYFDTGNDRVYVAFSDVSLSAVPLPAAFWLFFSGVISLIGFSKHRIIGTK